MAGTRTRRGKPLGTGKIKEILESGPIHTDYRPKPITSRTLGEKAKKLIKSEDNVLKEVKAVAIGAVSFWSSPTAPFVAPERARGNLDLIDAIAMMVRLSRTGSLILAAGVFEVPPQGAALDDIGVFDSRRQNALAVAEDALIDVCGDEEVFRAFAEPIPTSIRLGYDEGSGGVSYSYRQKPPSPLDVRLPNYDFETVSAYVQSISGRTLVSL